MIGTVCNAAAILVGGMAGLVRSKPLSPRTESFWKITLGVFAVFYGLRITWTSLHGPPGQMLKQLLTVMIGMSLGKGTGWLLRFQKMSNRLGQSARQRVEAAAAGDRPGTSEVFKICSSLFCAAPLGIVGAIQEGASNYPYSLLAKALMDGLGAMGLVRVLGWGVVCASLPVLVLQGTISLTCVVWVAPFLREHGLLNSMLATSGLMVFSVALVILDLKKINLADYLPSLVFAPVISWWWH